MEWTHGKPGGLARTGRGGRARVEWVHDVITRVARARADQEDAHAFRILQEQARIIGQRRVALRLMMAEVTGA